MLASAIFGLTWQDMWSCGLSTLKVILVYKSYFSVNWSFEPCFRAKLTLHQIFKIHASTYFRVELFPVGEWIDNQILNTSNLFTRNRNRKKMLWPLYHTKWYILIFIEKKDNFHNNQLIRDNFHEYFNIHKKWTKNMVTRWFILIFI